MLDNILGVILCIHLSTDSHKYAQKTKLLYDYIHFYMILKILEGILFPCYFLFEL